MRRLQLVGEMGATELERQVVDGWDAWDAVPRDGPAVFVIDIAVAERERRIHGRWINPTATPEEIDRQLTELLGRVPDEGAWAIVDQVGLGPVMLPEVLAADELPTAAQEALAGSRDA